MTFTEFPIPTVALSTLPQGQAKYLSDYASLAAAISTIGSTATTLYIAETPPQIDANVTVPANIGLVFLNDAAFSIATGVVVGITNGSILVAPPRAIFTGAGTISWVGSLPKTIYPEWFGAVGDGTTDDLAAFDAMIAASPHTANGEISQHILLSGGKTYRISDTWQIDTPVLLEGESASMWYSAAEITVDANKTGIQLHAVGTSAINPTRQATGSILRNFALTGLAGATTHVVTVNGLTVTRQSGAAFVAGYCTDGITIDINGYSYMIAAFVDGDTLTIYKPRLYGTVTNGSTDVGVGDYNLWVGTGEWVGQDVVINGGTYVIQSVQFTDSWHITLTSPYSGADSIGDIELQSLANTSDLPARPNLYHGVDNKTTAYISGMKVWSFAGNGLHNNSQTLPGIPGSTPNTNLSKYTSNNCYYNKGNGFYAKGVNCNQMLVANNDLSNSGGAGIFDGSFLGNNYLSNHTSGNYFAASYYTGDVNVSCLLGEYAEGGQPSSTFPQFVLIIGGNYGAGIAATSSATVLGHQGNVLNLANLQTQTTSGDAVVAFRAGTGTTPNNIFGFGSATEPSNLSSGGTLTDVRRYQYLMAFNQLAPGWYDLYQGGQYTDHAHSVIAMSGELASEGAGILAFPTGFRTGVSDGHITKVLRGTFTVDPTSINANTVSTQTFTLTGAAVGDNLTINIPAAGLTAGLLVMQATVSATNTVSITFYNTTASPINEASTSWSYLIVR